MKITDKGMFQAQGILDTGAFRRRCAVYNSEMRRNILMMPEYDTMNDDERGHMYLKRLRGEDGDPSVLVPREYWNWTFNDLSSERQALLNIFLEGINKPSMILVGPGKCGNGKTTALYACAHKVLQTNKPIWVEWVSWHDLAETIRTAKKNYEDEQKSDAKDLLNRCYYKCDWLFIDDLLPTDGDCALELLNILERRRERKTAVTTNLTHQGLVDIFTVRVEDRFSVVIKFEEESFRDQQAERW